jgi:hypothetical protein
MNVIIMSAAFGASLLGATESIALEPKRPPSLPALDFSCFMSQSVAFTTLGNTDNELGIGGDNYGKPVFRFTTIGAMLKVVEFPEFHSMRKEYSKTLSELRFDNIGNDYIFGWSDNEAIGLRIFMVNQRDRLASLLEVHPSSQTLPFGTLLVLKCNDTTETTPSPSWSESRRGGQLILDVWRASTATFQKPARAPSSVSPHSSWPAGEQRCPAKDPSQYLLSQQRCDRIGATSKLDFVNHH